MRKATFPVLDGNGKTIVPVPPVSGYATSDGGLVGTTAQRPVTPPHMTDYYDTDLLEEIFYHAGRARWESFIGDGPR